MAEVVDQIVRLFFDCGCRMRVAMLKGGRVIARGPGKETVRARLTSAGRELLRRDRRFEAKLSATSGRRSDTRRVTVARGSD